MQLTSPEELEGYPGREIMPAEGTDFLQVLSEFEVFKTLSFSVKSNSN